MTLLIGYQHEGNKVSLMADSSCTADGVRVKLSTPKIHRIKDIAVAGSGLLSHFQQFIVWIDGIYEGIGEMAPDEYLGKVFLPKYIEFTNKLHEGAQQKGTTNDPAPSALLLFMVVGGRLFSIDDHFLITPYEPDEFECMGAGARFADGAMLQSKQLCNPKDYDDIVFSRMKMAMSIAAGTSIYVDPPFQFIRLGLNGLLEDITLGNPHKYHLY